MSMFSKAVHSVTSHPLTTVMSPVTAGVQALTGMSAKQQMMTGATIGSGLGVLRALSSPGVPGMGGIPGLQGGPPLVNGQPAAASSGFSLSSLFPTLASVGAGIYGANQQAQAVQDANETNLEIAREQQTFSAQQAQNEMAFQERMSDTSYQRAVADMKAAGINPMLAIDNGGASTPAGAMGQSAGAVMQPVPSVVSASLSSAMDTLRTIQGLRESSSKIAENYADAGYKEQSTRTARFEGKLADTASDVFDKIKSGFLSTAKQFRFPNLDDLRHVGHSYDSVPEGN